MNVYALIALALAGWFVAGFVAALCFGCVLKRAGQRGWHDRPTVEPFVVRRLPAIEAVDRTTLRQSAHND